MLGLDHLDKLPLSNNELHGRTGQHKRKRKPISKVWSDLNYLMDHITKRVVDEGNMAENITLAAVDEMFVTIAAEFKGDNQVRTRNTQLQWTTVYKHLRVRQRTAVVGDDDSGAEQ